MQVLSTLSQMEISPVQGNARHGAGGAQARREEEEEGKGLRVLPKLLNKTPHPASSGYPTASPLASAGSGPALASASGVFRAIRPDGTGEKRGAPHVDLFHSARRPDENRKSSSSSV